MSFCDLVINLFNHCLHNNKKKKNYIITNNEYLHYKNNLN